MSRVDEIRARLAAATPGPWELETPLDRHNAGEHWDADPDWTEKYPRKVTVHSHWREPRNGQLGYQLCAMSGVHNETLPTARFIAATPEDISYLLARVEKLEGLLDKVADDDPCRLDHHGFCQAHGFTESPCPVAEARTLLADESEENEHGNK